MLSPSPRSLTIWLDSIEAARFLKVSVPMLRNMTSNGQIPFYKLGRRNRYRADELEVLLLKERRGPS
ncbi:MAG: helix-turn-helix domain-containing protein [Bdellovibrionales bacterium]